MLSLFVMIKSSWMVFWEHKTESVCSLSIIEETQVIVNSIEGYVLEAEDEETVFLIGGVDSWY